MRKKEEKEYDVVFYSCDLDFIMYNNREDTDDKSNVGRGPLQVGNGYRTLLFFLLLGFHLIV